MQDFIKSLSQQQKVTYGKIGILASIPNTHFGTKFEKNLNKQIATSQNQQELLKICMHSKPSIVKLFQQTLISFRSQKTGNSCLHIASQYGNINMVRYLLKQRLIPVNQLNKNKDTALLHTLKYNLGYKFEKTTLELIKYSDLKIKDSTGKYSYEIELPIINPIRARIMEYLKNQTFKQ